MCYLLFGLDTPVKGAAGLSTNHLFRNWSLSFKLKVLKLHKTPLSVNAIPGLFDTYLPLIFINKVSEVIHICIVGSDIAFLLCITTDMCVCVCLYV